MTPNNRHAEITATDHGPLVNIASWTLMCMSVLFTAFRLVSSIVLRGTAGKDDIVIVVATAFAIAQSVATSFMVKDGLGQHQSTLGPDSIARYQQASMASSVLYVVALASSRLSILIFLGRLISVAQKRFRIMMKATLVIILLHLVVEVLCLSFACNFPATWDYINGRCLDLVTFWDFDTAFDIATSVAILALPITIVSPLQMSNGRKMKAILAFIFQVPPCVFAAIRLVYLHRAFGSKDHTWESVDWQIWTQINLHFSIVAANMPSLNIFLEGFQSVLFRQNIESSVLSPTELHSFPYAKSSKSREKGGRRSISDSTKGIFGQEEGTSNTAIQATTSLQPDPVYLLRAREAEGGIYKTTEWTVLEDGDNIKRGHDAMF